MLTKEQIKQKILAGETVIAGPDVVAATAMAAYRELYIATHRQLEEATDVLAGIAHFSEDERARSEASATMVRLGVWADDGDERKFFRHVPHRDSDVEAFIKAFRETYSHPLDSGRYTLDALLDRYRLHADTGTPLSEPTPVDGPA